MSEKRSNYRLWKQWLALKPFLIITIISSLVVWLVKPVPWRMGLGEGTYVGDAVRGIPVTFNWEASDPEWSYAQIKDETGPIRLTIEHPYKGYNARRMEKAFVKNAREFAAQSRPCLTGRVGDVAYLLVGQQLGQLERMEQMRERIVFNLLNPSSDRKITKKERILTWMNLND